MTALQKLAVRKVKWRFRTMISGGATASASVRGQLAKQKKRRPSTSAAAVVWKYTVVLRLIEAITSEPDPFTTLELLEDHRTKMEKISSTTGTRKP